MIENNLKIENARIGLRNFSGKKSEYNRDGKRSFCVFFDHDTATSLSEDGWNIKWTKEEYEDERSGYMQVAVAFENIPPKIVQISGSRKTILSEDMVSNLDYAEFKNIDLIIRPYNWEVQGKTGVKAYLKTMYATLVDDDFGGKYSEDNMPF